MKLVDAIQNALEITMEKDPTACKHQRILLCDGIWLTYSLLPCSLGPGPSLFDLPFTFTIIHGMGRSRKLNRGRPGSIHHVNDVRWTRGGRKGGGAQLPKQRAGPSVRVLYCVFGPQTLAWWKLLVLTVKKLAFKFTTYIFEYWLLPPYVHLVSTHVMNAPRPSPF